MTGPGFTVPRASGGDPVDVYEVGQNGRTFVTLADINAFRAEDRKYGYVLVVLFLALGGFGVHAYRIAVAKRKQPAPSGAPGLGQFTTIRLAAAACFLAGSGGGYIAMFVPWSEALRHQNKVETSTAMIVLSTIFIVAPLAYLVAPRRTVAMLGTTTQPTALARKLAIGVTVLGFVVDALFMAGLRRLGYGG